MRHLVNDRRAPESLVSSNRRSTIIDHMATHHTDQPDLSQRVDGIRAAHRDSHSSGNIRRPHKHDLPAKDEVG